MPKHNILNLMTDNDVSKKKATRTISQTPTSAELEFGTRRSFNQPKAIAKSQKELDLETLEAYMRQQGKWGTGTMGSSGGGYLDENGGLSDENREMMKKSLYSLYDDMTPMSRNRSSLGTDTSRQSPELPETRRFEGGLQYLKTRRNEGGLESYYEN